VGEIERERERDSPLSLPDLPDDRLSYPQTGKLQVTVLITNLDSRGFSHLWTLHGQYSYQIEIIIMATTSSQAKAGDDDDIKMPQETTLGTSISYAYPTGPIEEIDEAYLRASKPSKFYRGVLFQMILFGA
jgi:hypothetical protein